MSLPRTLLALILAAAAGAAQAETPSAAEAEALRAATRLKPVADPAAPPVVYAPRYAGQTPLRIRGVARTAIDHRFAADGGVMGSLGFLCGLKPGADRAGGGAAYGYDPTGRFVGAKLRMTFR